MKKKDLPAMPFYVGDWKKDPGVQMLTFEEKGVWFELICLMWESEERGCLTINKRPIFLEKIAKFLKISQKKTEGFLKKFEELGLYSYRKTDGAIYSRKILKIVELQEKRKKAGEKGGNPILVNL